MPPEPVPANPGWDEDLAWLDRDPERETWLDRAREHDDPPGDEEFEDFEPLTPDELAEIREAAADELLAVEAATTGRRGPGQPGSARVFPGESSSPAAAFGPGMPLDVLPGCAGLALSADAAGEDDRFAGVSEGELIGVVCAWDRVEAHAAARKLAAIAELGRRNPKPEDAEFTADELGNALAESRTRAYALLGTADHLDTHLPGTRAALRDGTVSMSKAQIIANATGLLEPAEARAAEAKVLDRAARLTPGALRAAIARAVIEVAPEKAKERRETAAKFARVERWREDSGNAALAGRELPPDEVLAVDERITWWADELRKAGLEGGMDAIRARALLDLLLNKDSRPRQDQSNPVGAAPGGFAGRANLTVPLATLTSLAGRPGELSGLGPIDPWLARDLATAAAANPKSTWCVTVTDEHGHADRARLRHDPNPRTTGNARGQGRRGSPSPRPAGTGRPAATEPGGCTPPAMGRTCWSPSTRSPRRTATTGLKAGAMIRALSSGTCPRSGTPPVLARSAGGPPPNATTSTTRHTKRADAPASVMAAQSAVTTTGSSSTRSGRSTSSPTEPSGGPPRPGVPTPPNPRGTPYEGRSRG